jgi:hypothetical protein
MTTPPVATPPPRSPRLLDLVCQGLLSSIASVAEFFRVKQTTKGGEQSVRDKRLSSG